MKRVVMALVLLAPGLASAEIYKCPKPGGGVEFSGRPCGGLAETDDRRIEVEATKVGGSLATEDQLEEYRRRADGQGAKGAAEYAPAAKASVCKSFSSTELRRLIAQNQVVRGMTRDAVREAWGDPSEVYSRTWAFGPYGSRRYVYFDDGCVDRIN